jgi:hypothetical protein
VIQTIRKTGFLITDASRMGRSIEVLRQLSRTTQEPALRGIADWLDSVPVQTYYEPLPAVEQIEEVA